MKLKDVERGTWVIKPVPLRLVNTSEPAQPGQAPSGEPVTVMVGVRVLLGVETDQVYEKALADATARGVTEWKDDHSICRLRLMVHTLAIACVDPDSDPKNPEPFFQDAEHILTSKNVGTDNIAYLYERWVDFVDESSIETSSMTVEQVVGTLLAEAQKPENAPSPLDFMRPGMRKSFMHTTAVLFSNLLTAKSDSGSSGDTGSGNSTSRSTSNEPAGD